MLKETISFTLTGWKRGAHTLGYHTRTPLRKDMRGNRVRRRRQAP
jgi:hypothetical protein